MSEQNQRLSERRLVSCVIGRKALSVVIPLFLSAVCARSQVSVTLGRDTAVIFATVEEGRKLVMTRDDFVERMSTFDRAARTKTDRDVSEEEYLKFVGESVVSWTEAEKEKLTSAFRGVQAPLETLARLLPAKVYLIKTTGGEEGGAPYTRLSAIVFPASKLEERVPKIQEIICHELFHIISRENPELREQLYAAIGFVKCSEVVFPEELKTRKITNPDAPRNDHYIRISVEGTNRCAVPILFSSTPKYDIAKGGEFFNYLQFRFLLIEPNPVSEGVKPSSNAQGAELVRVRQVSGFFEQTGRNTEYIIHPEEILADNFALIVLRQRPVSSPAVLEKLERILNAEADKLRR